MQDNGSGAGRRLTAVVVTGAAVLLTAGCSGSAGQAAAPSATTATATATATTTVPAGDAAPAGTACAGVVQEISTSTRATGHVTGVDVGRACDEARVTTSLTGTAQAHTDAVEVCSLAVVPAAAQRVGGVVVVAADGSVLAVGTVPGDCAAYTG